MEEERDCIEEFRKIVQNVIAPVFKEHGFKRSGLHFYKSTNNIIQAFSILKSRVTGGDYISFDFELGLISEEIFKEYYRFPFPKVPRATIGTLRLGLNSISCQYRNYQVIMDTDIPQLVSDIQFDLKKSIIPFFEKYNSTNSWAELIDLNIIGLKIVPAVTRFLVYLKIGRKEDAIIELNKSYLFALQQQTNSIEYYSHRRNSKQKKDIIEMHEEWIASIKHYAEKYGIALIG